MIDNKPTRAELIAALHVFINESDIRNVLPETRHKARVLISNETTEPDFAGFHRLR